MLTEKEIENAILDYLQTIKGMVAWKNQTTGLYDPVKKCFRPLRGKHSGKGSTDIIGCFRGRFIGIEVKRPKNFKLSDDQKAFIDKINMSGGIAFVAKSIEDVKKALENYL